jgi:hypothetical protein
MLQSNTYILGNHAQHFRRLSQIDKVHGTCKVLPILYAQCGTVAVSSSVHFDKFRLYSDIDEIDDPAVCVRIIASSATQSNALHRFVYPHTIRVSV